MHKLKCDGHDSIKNIEYQYYKIIGFIELLPMITMTTEKKCCENQNKSYYYCLIQCNLLFN